MLDREDERRVLAAVACLKAVECHSQGTTDGSAIVSLLCADFERGVEHLSAIPDPRTWIAEVAKGIGGCRARLRRLALTWLTEHYRPLSALFSGYPPEVRVAHLSIAIWDAANKYDLESGVPFRAYLLWRIRNLRWRLRRYVMQPRRAQVAGDEGEGDTEEGELQVNPNRYLYHQFHRTGDVIAAHQTWLDALRGD